MRNERFVYSVGRVRRAGRRDGRSWRWVLFPFKKEQKNPIPPENQSNPADYEQEIKGAAKGHIERIAQRWRKEDEKLAKAHVKALSERHEAEASLKKEAREADQALQEYNAAQGSVNALGLPEMSGRTAVIWLIVLAILELPLNRVVFEVFQASWIETFLVACLVAVAIPILAHLTGYELRQDRKTKRDIAVLVIGVAAAIGLIGVIAYIRSLYLEGENQLAILGIHLNPRSMTVVFIIVNVAVYLAAMILTYHASHPKGKVFRQAIGRLKEARRSLKKESGEAQEARRRLEAASKAVDLTRVCREKRFNYLQEEANAIVGAYEHLVQVYRNANLEARSQRGRPACFNKDPQGVNLPAALKNLTPISWSPGPTTMPTAKASSAGASAQAAGANGNQP